MTKNVTPDGALSLDSETRLARRYDKFRGMGRLGEEFVQDAQ